MESGPLVEEFYLGEPNLEAFYTSSPVSAMAVQPFLSPAAKRARSVEARGYHKKPPSSGERECYVADRFDALDEISIAATRRGLDYVPEEVTAEIKTAYEESDIPDAWWIAWRCEQHVHLVVAVLRYLYSSGEIN